MRINLIGEKIMIIDAGNKTLIGLSGKVIDETKNLIIIEGFDGKIRKVLKKGIKFKINTHNQLINGEDVIGRPEVRLKSKSKVKPRW